MPGKSIQKIRVGIDLRPLIEKRISGVKVYTKSIINALSNEDLELIFFYQSKKRLKHIHKDFPKAIHIKKSNLLFNLKSIFLLQKCPKKLSKNKVDLYFLPDRRPFYKCSAPVVMTLHDDVPEMSKNSLSLKSRLWHYFFPLKKLLKNVDALICPSSAIASPHKDKMPVAVTYEGANVSRAQKAPANKKQYKDFFLCISPADPRKRLPWIAKAAEKFPKAKFVVIGIKEKDSRFKKMKLSKQKNLHFIGELSEEEKAWFLQNAIALIAISKREGFDLPALEAISIKKPVILSDIPVHHELYKQKRPMVKNKEDLYLQIHQAINGQLETPKLRGVYTWERAAKETSLLFRRVVHNKNRK